MPVYEYQCADCQRHFEELQKVSDKPLKKCKICGGKVTRLISQTSFSLKGGGWYKDGYSSAKPKDGAPSDSKPAESKAGKSPAAAKTSS